MVFVIFSPGLQPNVVGMHDGRFKRPREGGPELGGQLDAFPCGVETPAKTWITTAVWTRLKFLPVACDLEPILDSRSAGSFNLRS